LRHYLEKTHHKKGWQIGSNSKSACHEALSSNPVLPKNKVEERGTQQWERNCFIPALPCPPQDSHQGQVTICQTAAGEKVSKH
jgi:hypothetical protein